VSISVKKFSSRDNRLIFAPRVKACARVMLELNRLNYCSMQGAVGDDERLVEPIRVGRGRALQNMCC